MKFWRFGEMILCAAAFALAHTQSPLYYSNQNQYFLHGAAQAGYGHLANDWLANTRDPTPVFSWLVAAIYRYDPWGLQPAYFGLLMVYFGAAWALALAVPGFVPTRSARWAFAAVFTLTHAAIVRVASIQLTSVDYPWYGQAGLAAQYMLGPGIQPSAFGVLLLVAVAVYARGGSPVVAAAIAAAACVFHATYLLPAALLISGFLIASWLATRDVRLIAGMAAAASLFGSVGCVNALHVLHSPGADAAEALRILVEVRIPHHCVVSRWFDAIAAWQIVWMGIGGYFLRRQPLGWALCIAASGGLLLTGLQLATGSYALALAFPWRISVLLVPVATIVVAAQLAARWPRGGGGDAVAATLLLALALSGVVVMLLGWGYQMAADEEPLYAYLRQTAGPQDVYLVPVSFPKVGSGRGAVSNTFRPPPRAEPGTNQIPVDLQRFRLASGACLYVDFKSIPYSAAEVLEWYRRMQFASSLTTTDRWHSPGIVAELKREGITHVVWPRSKPLVVDGLELMYIDAAYAVYRVNGAVERTAVRSGS
ncbi:MAG: DUF6798 domain-containing protein [Gemmataceae bacterium]|nr:hypothetical protein [Gemmata sp.]MDW8199439.1 DUF6798 domain-containing protein [Gemmataceae bacterium]